MATRIYSGKKVVIGLLSGMVITGAAVVAIAQAAGGSQDEDRPRRAASAGGGGGSMWKNIDNDIKRAKAIQDGALDRNNGDGKS